MTAVSAEKLMEKAKKLNTAYAGKGDDLRSESDRGKD